MRVAGGALELEPDGGRVLRFPAVWLRDNCPCPDCADPVTSQKLHDITDIPADCSVTAADEAGAAVAVTFGPDGHRGQFPRGWLLAHPLDGYPADPREEDGKTLWRTPAPAEQGMVLGVAESFGFARETNYGKLFDVRVEQAPGNLAFTSRQIRPHTDNPYRDPVPAVQLLHCLRAAGQGGGTTLADGFAAAADLRETDPASFGAVTGTSVSFGYQDERAGLRASMPLIQLSPRGRVRGVRFNNRSAQPLLAPYAHVTAFYPAYRRWAELLADPARQVRIRLSPGDCLVFDNTRRWRCSRDDR